MLVLCGCGFYLWYRQSLSTCASYNDSFVVICHMYRVQVPLRPQCYEEVYFCWHMIAIRVIS
jgi:hypothetical protein